MKCALLLATLAATAAGCAKDNDITMSILQMQALTQTNMCVALGTPGVAITEGILDTSFGNGYIAAPVVRNNLVSSNATGGVVGVERNGIQVIGANVKLTTPTGGPIAGLSASQSAFFYPSAAGRIDPMMTAAMFVEVLPAATAMSLVGQTVVAEVRPVGMHSSDQVVGGSIEFPIRVCNGCLRSNLTCPLPANTMVQPDPCFLGQDTAGTCCNDPTLGYVCGSGAISKM